jgi:hypothetical protein
VVVEALAQEKKGDSEVIEVQLQEKEGSAKNQVLSKEKKEHLDDQKVLLINQRDAHLKQPKTEDQEEVN